MHTEDASQVAPVAQKIINKDMDFINSVKAEQKRLIEEYGNKSDED